MDFQMPRFDFGVIEHVVQDRQQRPSAAVNHLYIVLLSGSQRGILQ
ncbi:Uncharacterised protein [Vibrio cholerae]|nr:Uncharacterised protein [Vibrio cholerae]CSB06520.1 Uncharacterised protein [Vibrio cholerae]CSC69162.1 Uncharacterised protein [Vibrio cholerae]